VGTQYRARAADQPRFCEAIGRVRPPAWLPVPGFAMKLLLGEMADMITTGQRVVPKQEVI
jgi:NAD dependent epimerase/dehydratase family enzyme